MRTGIVLPHAFYRRRHLDQVREQMRLLGPPSIIAVHIPPLWFALEGCHRLRAAVELDLVPVLVPSSDPHNLKHPFFTILADRPILYFDPPCAS